MGMSYEDPPPIEEDDPELEGADPRAWTEDAAASHRAALEEAAQVQHEVVEWKPSAHLRYLEQVGEAAVPATLKLNPRAKAAALEAYSKTGRVGFAAAAAGVSRQTLLNHLNEDPVFNDAWIDAKDDFATGMQLRLYQRGFIGTPKPIVGRVAKDCDGIIGYELTRSDTIAMAMAKAFMPDLYVEKLQVDANVTGGVLVVGAPLTPEAWLVQHGGQQPLQSIPLLEQLRKELGSDLPPR